MEEIEKRTKYLKLSKLGSAEEWLAEECFIRKIQSGERKSDPSEHSLSQKAITIKLVAIHWALFELWKEGLSTDGFIKLQRYFNKLYLKVLSIFCRMVYTFEL